MIEIGIEPDTEKVWTERDAGIRESQARKGSTPGWIRPKSQRPKGVPEKAEERKLEIMKGGIRTQAWVSYYSTLSGTEVVFTKMCPVE
jgi:hypothetical protein